MSMRFREDSQEFMFPVTPKEEIDRCLNCTRSVCYGTCQNGIYREVARGKVQCVETGELFKNLKAAAEAAGRCKSAMTKCLKGETETCGGLHWRVVEGVAE